MAKRNSNPSVSSEGYDWHQITDQIQTIMTELTVSITVQDKRGRLIYANQVATNRLHYPQPGDGKRPVADPTKHFLVYDQSDRLLTLAELPSRRVMRGEPWAEAVLHFVGKTVDEEFWLIVKAVPVKDDSGETKFIITISNNITALKQTEIKLRENNDRLMNMLEDVMDAEDFDSSPRLRGSSSGAGKE